MYIRLTAQIDIIRVVSGTGQKPDIFAPLRLAPIP